MRENFGRLSNLWKTNAAINQSALDYDELNFDPALDDFNESLLPFHQLQAWQEAPTTVRSCCLSYAWAIYNLKTIYIECDIVTPVCEDLIKIPPAGSCNQTLLQELMAETLLDEALHTKMSVSATNYIYQMRGLPQLRFQDFNLINWRNRILAQCNAEWERRLTRFAIACASETLITDYLKTMTEDSGIQPICHLVTQTHAMDEWRHSSVFSSIAMDIIHSLSTKERTYLQHIIEQTVSMFTDKEMGAWRQVFTMVDLPGSDTLLANSDNLSEIKIYQDSVNSLLQHIGLKN